MPRLRYFGDAIYRGYDPGLRRMIEVHRGGTVRVSDVMAERLRADFPNLWRIVEDEERRGFRPQRTRMTHPTEDKNNGPLQRG
jgi:hypothetical protein